MSSLDFGVLLVEVGGRFGHFETFGGSGEAGDSNGGVGDAAAGVGDSMRVNAGVTGSIGVDVRDGVFLDFLDSVNGAGETDPLRFLDNAVDLSLFSFASAFFFMILYVLS